MKLSFITSGVAFLFVLLCGILYHTSPNYVAEDWRLVESFWYIPIWIVFLSIWLFWLVVGFVFWLKEKKKKK